MDLRSFTITKKNHSTPPYVKIGIVHPEHQLAHVSVSADMAKLKGKAEKSKNIFVNFIKEFSQKYPQLGKFIPLINMTLWQDISAMEKSVSNLVKASSQNEKPRNRRSSQSTRRWRRTKRWSVFGDFHPGEIISAGFTGLSNLFNLPTLQKLETATNVLTIEMNHINEAIEDISVELEDLTEHVSGWLEEQAEILTTLENKIMLDQACTQFGITFRKITRHVESILQAIPDMNAGIIPETIVPFSLAEEIVFTLEDKVTQYGQTLAIQNPADLYKCKASYYMNANMILKAFQHVPVISREQGMQLYEFIPLTIPSGEKFYQLQDIPRYVALGNGLIEDQMAMELDDLEKQCDSFRQGIFICHDIPILKNVNSNCLPALMAQSDKPPCLVREVINPEENYYWTITKILALFFPVPTEVFLDCDTTQKKSVHHGVILRKLEQHCTLETSKWKFASTATISKSSYKNVKFDEAIIELVGTDLRVGTTAARNRTTARREGPRKVRKNTLPHQKSIVNGRKPLAIAALVLALCAMLLGLAVVLYLKYFNKQGLAQLVQNGWLRRAMNILNCYCKGKSVDQSKHYLQKEFEVTTNLYFNF